MTAGWDVTYQSVTPQENRALPSALQQGLNPPDGHASAFSLTQVHTAKTPTPTLWAAVPWPQRLQRGSPGSGGPSIQDQFLLPTSHKTCPNCSGAVGRGLSAGRRGAELRDEANTTCRGTLGA